LLGNSEGLEVALKTDCPLCEAGWPAKPNGLSCKYTQARTGTGRAGRLRRSERLSSPLRESRNGGRVRFQPCKVQQRNRCRGVVDHPPPTPISAAAASLFCRRLLAARRRPMTLRWGSGGLRLCWSKSSPGRPMGPEPWAPRTRVRNAA